MTYQGHMRKSPYLLALADVRTCQLSRSSPALTSSLTAIILNDDGLHCRPNSLLLCAVLAAVIWVGRIAENGREAEYATKEIELKILCVFYLC